MSGSGVKTRYSLLLMSQAEPGGHPAAQPLAVALGRLGHVQTQFSLRCSSCPESTQLGLFDPL